MHEQPYRLSGSIELAAFLPCAISELLDQIFISGSKIIRSVKVRVAQPILAVMADDIVQLIVRKLVLVVEFDADQHTLDGWVSFFNGFGRFVKLSTNVVFQVLDARPSRSLRNEECICVFTVLTSKLLRLLVRLPLAYVVADDLLLLFLKSIAQMLDEQHPKDVILILRGIHIAPQYISCFP